MKKIVLALLAAFSLLLLSGCGMFKPIESLYTLPRASEEYQSLQSCLEELQSSGLDYAAPLSGSNTQPVQMIDLDYDGCDEAVAFFRDTSGGEQPLKIYIFRQDSENNYQAAAIISGEGTAINSVVSAQLVDNSTSSQELVVSWQISSNIYMLSAYSLKDEQAEQILPFTSYTRYSVADLDQDGMDELVLFQLDASDARDSSADYYDSPDGNALTKASTAHLSTELSSIEKLQVGVTSDSVPAIYATGYIMDAETGEISTTRQITDVLLLRSGQLNNISFSLGQENSLSTVRSNLAGIQDINGDGVLEIPISFQLPAYDTSTNDLFYGIAWMHFASDGSSTIAITTYYNSTDGWYLILPDDLSSHLYVARQDTNEGLTSERGIVFYYKPEQSEQSNPTPIHFLTIYRDTGSNRTTRAAEQGWLSLKEDTDVNYSATFSDCAYDTGITDNNIYLYFKQITTDWLSD